MMTSEDRGKHASSLIKFQTAMRELQPISVVTYGDSWTYGSVAEGWHEARDAGYDSALIHGSWALKLKAKLVDLNPQVQFYNLGAGGWTSLQGDEAYEANIAPLHPDYLILNFGINDWKNAVPLSYFSIAMERIIRQAYAIGCQVILWTSGPLSVQSAETYGWSAPWDDTKLLYTYEEFLAEIHRLAASYNLLLADAAQEIVDLWQAGTDISEWFFDSIHFKQEGHDIIYKSLCRILQLDLLGEKTNT